MQLTKNFTLWEFRCRDGVPVPPEYIPNARKVAENLQVLRDEIGQPIIINSAYRYPAYNKRIGGASKSQHLTASAADIRTKGYTPRQLANVIERLIKEGKMRQGGIGVYPTFTHYDIRGVWARW